MRHVDIAARIRAPRVAVLTDINDENWEQTCLRIIEFFTRTWGGFGNIIIPTDGVSIGATFWKLLEQFDPDLLYTYSRSGRDLEIEAPDEFQRLYQEHASQWEKQIGHAAHSSALDHIREYLQKASNSTFVISRSLEQELKERLAPFYFDGHVVKIGGVRANYTPQYPLTDVADLLSHAKHSAQILDVVDAENRLSPLWWASVFGHQNKGLKEKLAEGGIELVGVGGSTTEFWKLVELAIEGESSAASKGIASTTSQAFVSAPRSSLPWALSNLGLDGFRSSDYADWDEPAIAIAGSTIQDFALYYGLARIRGRTVWTPPFVAKNAFSNGDNTDRSSQFLFCDALDGLRRQNAGDNPRILLGSISLTPVQLDELKESLERASPSRLNLDTFAELESLIPELPIRFAEAKSGLQIRSFSVGDDRMIRLFETPIPKGFTKIQPSRHRWITELSISQYHLPRHQILGSLIFEAKALTTNEVRVSAEGPAYLCPNPFIIAESDIATSVVRPNIRIPKPFDVFVAIARAAQLEVRTSDKGFYANESCRKVGGLSALAHLLRSQEGQALCEAFKDRTEPKQNEHNAGVLLLDRRYLDSAAVETAIGNAERARSLLTNLSSSSVLYRGFILQCASCRFAEFIPLGRLTDRFECSRCHRDQIFTQDHWKFPYQPNLYYQLDEVVYQGLINNMHVPLLTLDLLRRRSKESFLYAHELQFRQIDNAKPEMEMDINCIVDGKLIFGEAKIDHKLAQTKRKEVALLDKFKDMAMKLNASQIVFATYSNEWDQGTVTHIQNCFRGSPIAASLLTNSDLLS